jgi:putative MFS transporter
MKGSADGKLSRAGSWPRSHLVPQRHGVLGRVSRLHGWRVAEYGLKSALNPHGDIPVALLPLAGISGTVVGSFVWGWLGDRIGRRASVLLAGVLFVTTAICGAMPGFSWNLLMCFLMGLGVGGMLPITFALLAETIPARHRGWLMVLIGGDIAGAYVITSWFPRR